MFGGARRDLVPARGRPQSLRVPSSWSSRRSQEKNENGLRSRGASDGVSGLCAGSADEEAAECPVPSDADASFDGVLVWDALEYLSAPMLTATVERLFRIAKPGSYLLAVFQAQEKAVSVPQYSFRIQDSKTLLVADRGTRKPEQVFNNRSLEKLFQKFESLKFFLARDKLREVIVRR